MKSSNSSRLNSTFRQIVAAAKDEVNKYGLNCYREVNLEICAKALKIDYSNIRKEFVTTSLFWQNLLNVRFGAEAFSNRYLILNSFNCRVPNFGTRNRLVHCNK